MYQSPADHPLVTELALLARRSEPDPVLKSRALAFRKEVVAVLGRKTPGLVVRLVTDEINRLAEAVLTEGRQWREAQEWADHRRHLQAVRAMAHLHLFLSRTGLALAKANESLGAAHVRRWDDES